MGGYPDGSFRPNHPITRAEACVIVNNMLRRTPDRDFIRQHAGDLVSFGDLTGDHWAYFDIMEACNSHAYSLPAGQERWEGLTSGT